MEVDKQRAMSFRIFSTGFIEDNFKERLQKEMKKQVHQMLKQILEKACSS